MIARNTTECGIKSSKSAYPRAILSKIKVVRYFFRRSEANLCVVSSCIIAKIQQSSRSQQVPSFMDHQVHFFWIDCRQAEQTQNLQFLENRPLRIIHDYNKKDRMSTNFIYMCSRLLHKGVHTLSIWPRCGVISGMNGSLTRSCT